MAQDGSGAAFPVRWTTIADRLPARPEREACFYPPKDYWWLMSNHVEITEIEVNFAGQKAQKVERLQIDYTDAGAANMGTLRFSLPGKVEKPEGPQELVVTFKGEVESADYKSGKTEIVLKFGRGLERNK